MVPVWIMNVTGRSKLGVSALDSFLFSHRCWWIYACRATNVLFKRNLNIEKKKVKPKEKKEKEKLSLRLSVSLLLKIAWKSTIYQITSIFSSILINQSSFTCIKFVVNTFLYYFIKWNILKCFCSASIYVIEKKLIGILLCT